jgi:thiol:disulfide interchange protein
MDTVVNFFIIGIPECIVLTMLVLALLRVNYAKTWQIITTGVILAAAVLIVRLIVPGTGMPGIHTAAAMLTLAMLVAHFYRISKEKSLIVSIFAIFLTALSELPTYSLIAKILHINVISLTQHRLYWIFTNWLHIACLAIITAVITRTGWYQQKKNPNKSLKF